MSQSLFVLCFKPQFYFNWELNNIIQYKSLQNVSSNSFQNQTKWNTHHHHTTPVSVAWALLLDSNGVQCLAFVAGNKKVGGGFLYFPSVCFLQCICLTACITVYQNWDNTCLPEILCRSMTMNLIRCTCSIIVRHKNLLYENASLS